MKQSGTLDNACGIIACIHAALNSDVVIKPDSTLGKFQADSANKTPADRATALEQNEEWKAVHKNYANQGNTEAISGDQSKVKHHFIAFVVKDGKLVELDGLKKGPNVIGDCDDVLRGSIKEI